MSVRSTIDYIRQAQIFALAQVISDGGNRAPIKERADAQKFIRSHGNCKSCFFILSSEDMENAVLEHPELFDPCGRYGTYAWKGEAQFFTHYNALRNYPSFDVLCFPETIKSFPLNAQHNRSTALELKAIELLRILKGLNFSHEGLILRGKNGKYHEDGKLQGVSQFSKNVNLYLSSDGSTLLEVKGIRGAFTCRGIMALEAEKNND